MRKAVFACLLTVASAPGLASASQAETASDPEKVSVSDRCPMGTDCCDKSSESESSDGSKSTADRTWSDIQGRSKIR